MQGERLALHSKLASYDLSGGASWSKREADWFEIEEKAVFKNNVKNFTDGDLKNVDAFIRAVEEQQKRLNQHMIIFE